jgi:hypothetical protein
VFTTNAIGPAWMAAIAFRILAVRGAYWSSTMRMPSFPEDTAMLPPAPTSMWTPGATGTVFTSTWPSACCPRRSGAAPVQDAIEQRHASERTTAVLFIHRHMAIERPVAHDNAPSFPAKARSATHLLDSAGVPPYRSDRAPCAVPRCLNAAPSPSCSSMEPSR